MGNSNNKNYNSYKHNSSQLYLSDIIGKQCIKSSSTSFEELRPWCKISRRNWSQSTLSDPYSLSKTAWPVPRFEAYFLPEFPVKEGFLKSEYDYIDFIANGAYGKVFKIQNRQTKELYALKVISKAQVIAKNAIQQAKQEILTQSSVGHHIFIVNVVSRWQQRKTLYILAEYVGGGELWDLIKDYGCLPENVVRIYVAEIALALDFLHNAGIIHRDLKASNVLLDYEGHIKLTDFGLAKWLPRMQRTNTFCGTLEYVAPEIVKKQFYSHEVDWWSLGVLTCFLLTNEYPRHISSLDEDYTDIQLGLLPDSKINLTDQSIDLLLRLLQTEPRLRIKSVLALQRIAFFMGYDIKSYTLKKESPFKLLNKKIVIEKITSNNKNKSFNSSYSKFSLSSS